MDSSIFLAQILGPYCLIVGISVLLNLDFYQKVIDDFCQNPTFIYFGGVLALIIGLLIIGFHNIWIWGWPVLITLVGWLGVIKGITLLFFPHVLTKFASFYKKNTAILIFRLILIVVIGVFLTIFGYMV